MKNFNVIKFCSLQLLLLVFVNTSFSQTKTIAPGSVFINMGVTPQTIANGLKLK